MILWFTECLLINSTYRVGYTHVIRICGIKVNRKFIANYKRRKYRNKGLTAN
jgi:hypothetical protein